MHTGTAPFAINRAENFKLSPGFIDQKSRLFLLRNQLTQETPSILFDSRPYFQEERYFDCFENRELEAHARYRDTVGVSYVNSLRSRTLDLFADSSPFYDTDLPPRVGEIIELYYKPPSFHRITWETVRPKSILKLVIQVTTVTQGGISSRSGENPGTQSEMLGESTLSNASATNMYLLKALVSTSRKQPNTPFTGPRTALSQLRQGTQLNQPSQMWS